MTPKPRRTRAYTTRKLPSELLDRIRMLAATKSALTGERVTMEAVVAEVIREGLPVVEEKVTGR